MRGLHTVFLYFLIGILVLSFCAANVCAADASDDDFAPYGNVFKRELSAGMIGTDVAALQSMLYELGYFPYSVDGDFGPATEAAVTAFQSEHGINADGIVNPDTVKALNTALIEFPYEPFYLIYDSILETGTYYTVNPIFYDGLDHYVTLSSDSSVIHVEGMNIYAVHPGAGEVYADCEGHKFSFFVSVRDSMEVASKLGELKYANNLGSGLNKRLQEIAGYTGDVSKMSLFFGDCYLDERLFLTDLYTARYGGTNVYSVALSGSTTEQWLSYIRNYYEYQPASMLISLGMNDLRHGATVPETIYYLETLFERIHENMPDTMIYWWKIIPHIGAEEQYYKNIAVNTAIEEYAAHDSRLVVIDSYDAVSTDYGVADLSLYQDNLHPNRAGYDRLFEKTLEAGLEIIY